MNGEHLLTHQALLVPLGAQHGPESLRFDRERDTPFTRWPPGKDRRDTSPGANCLGTEEGLRVTLDLDSGLRVTQGPDVHHHVHATGGKVLVVGGPGQADDLCVVPIKYIVFLVARNKGGR